MINSCQKGKVGEREVRDLFRAAGFEARRGKQYAGHEDAPDVVTSLDDILHVESKWVENLAVHKAVEQAKRDSGKNQMPVVFHRKNRTEWLVTVTAVDFLSLLVLLYPDRCNTTPST